MSIGSYARLLRDKAPEVTYFDHLYGEFVSFGAEAIAPSEGAKHQITSILERRAQSQLTWNDIFLFELILSRVRPTSTLRGKVVSLRHDYRSIAGQAEYDEYLASRPKDLLDPPDPNDPPDRQANYDKLLREDLRDLLGRVYLRYAVLPVREERLKHLTVSASILCGAFLGVLIVLIILMLIGRGLEGGLTSLRNGNFSWLLSLRIPSLSIFVVLSAGAMGGFVSALQRIQSSPNEGNSIYNLALLFHGSYAVFVAPLTGAIFSILLYLMFTGGILQGRFFPGIYTPPARTVTLTPSGTGPNARGNQNTNSQNANVGGNQNRTENANAAPNVNNGNANTNGNSVRVGAAPNVNAGGANRGAANSGGNGNTAGGNANANGNNAAANTNGNANDAAGSNVNANAGSNANSNASAVNGNANLNGNARSNSNASPVANANANANETKESQDVPTESISIQRFLIDSGPAGGADYALLIIWSFIAGFAERFVPDALNRLVVGKQADGQPRS
jgi:hypothetical protein